MSDGPYDVFCFEAFEEEAASLRRHFASGPTSTLRIGETWKTIQEYGQYDIPAPVISVRTQSVIPHAWAGDCKAIISRSTGYDHLLRYQKETGTEAAIGYLPLYCARAVAEHAILLVMSLLRHLPLQQQNMNKFSRDGLTGRECANQRMTIFGVGHIGREIHDIAAALGMRVNGVDIEQQFDDVNYVDREQGLRDADIIVCAMNLTEQNAAYFNEAAWKTISPGAIFVNISRGELSPSVDLLAAIESGALGGAGLDAYDHEAELGVTLRNEANETNASDDAQVRATLSLMQKTNVICTPHNAFNTFEAVERKSADTATQLAHYMEHGTMLWTATEDDET